MYRCVVYLYFGECFLSSALFCFLAQFSIPRKITSVFMFCFLVTCCRFDVLDYQAEVIHPACYQWMAWWFACTRGDVLHFFTEAVLILLLLLGADCIQQPEICFLIIRNAIHPTTNSRPILSRCFYNGPIINCVQNLFSILCSTLND